MTEGPLTQLVEHTRKVDTKEENRRWVEASQELWTSVAESGWWDSSTKDKA